jgi:ATP-dependent DNA helicase RecQ
MSSPPIELAAREYVLAGRDTLVVMSDGSGESAILEIADWIKPGLTVVVAPVAAPPHDEYVHLEAEQLANEAVLAKLRELGPALIVVEHAHCIAEAGDDFSPDYLRLGPFIAEMGHPPVLALTAVVPEQVRDEIIERLHMHDPAVIVRD